MAHLRAEPAADARHHRERGRAGRLVHEDDPARLEPLRRHQRAGADAAANSRRRKFVICSIDSSLEKPAAWRWPPPPDSRAIAETPSSSKSFLSRYEITSPPPSYTCARSSARASSFSFANWTLSYTPWKTLCTSAPASTSSAASRSAFGVVFAYWNRPVSVTRAT